MKIIISFIAIIIMISQLNAQDDNTRELKTQAVKALESFSKIVSKTNYKTLGFENAGEISKASLGVPIRVFMIRLDHLKEYKRENDPSELLVGGDYYIYPVLVGNKVRSAIDMEKSGKTWKATGYGGSNLIKTITGIRSRVSEKTRVDKSKFFLVRIPALNQIFIGFGSGSKLMLTPRVDIPEYKFKEGEPIPAKDVMEILVPIAQEHNGEPG